MKKIGLWGSLAFVAILAIVVYMAFDFGEKSPIFVAGDVEISPELEGQASGIQTMFLTLFDADSGMPMPYGAVRFQLSEAPKGKFYSFIITKELLQVMSQDQQTPPFFRVKARLDQDGAGGMDQSGDLIGELPRVPFGTQNLTIKIDKKVE